MALNRADRYRSRSRTTTTRTRTGDNWYNVAARNGVSAASLMRRNPGVAAVRAGQTLRLPQESAATRSPSAPGVGAVPTTVWLPPQARNPGTGPARGQQVTGYNGYVVPQEQVVNRPAWEGQTTYYGYNQQRARQRDQTTVQTAQARVANPGAFVIPTTLGTQGQPQITGYTGYRVPSATTGRPTLDAWNAQIRAQLAAGQVPVNAQSRLTGDALEAADPRAYWRDYYKTVHPQPLPYDVYIPPTDMYMGGGGGGYPTFGGFGGGGGGGGGFEPYAARATFGGPQLGGSFAQIGNSYLAGLGNTTWRV